MIDSDFSVGFKQGQAHGKQIMLEKIEDIKTEINSSYVKVENDYDHGRNYGLYMALQIIDKHIEVDE